MEIIQILRWQKYSFIDFPPNIFEYIFKDLQKNISVYTHSPFFCNTQITNDINFHEAHATSGNSR